MSDMINKRIAKVNVVSSNLIARSNFPKTNQSVKAKIGRVICV